MNNAQKMRFWLNEARNFQINMDELWGFMRLPKNSTGLPYDIYLDNGKMYQRFNHELWLYANINGEKIPITISEKPVVKKMIKGKAELEWIYNFIKANLHLLINLANGKVSLDAFFAVVQRNEDLRNKFRLDEMSTLYPSETLLPVEIWVDEDKLFEPHAPRIKFQADKQEKNTNNFPSMEIQNPDRIHNMNKCDLSTKEINQIKAFVRANKELLLKLASTDFSIENFKATMVPVDKNGVPVKNETPIYFKSVNGFSRAFYNGKYDFIKPDGTNLVGRFIFDDADNFADYGNDILIARVVKNGKEMFIDTEGNEVQF